MATRWSSDYNVIEIRDFDAKTMVVDYTGSTVFLTDGKKYGFVEIYKSANILHPKSYKFEINSTQWNPTYHNQHLCALAYNTKVEILNLNNVDMISSKKLNFHTRLVLDLDWHYFDPNILASAALDSYVNIWDIRADKRPALSLSTIGPASKVRWSHLNKYLVATAHTGNVKIWDQRKASHPLSYISAHQNTIYCLDWSYTNEYQFVTSSKDCTVKFFEVNNLHKPLNVLNTATQVWRAKYTPFGDGILIVLVPPEKSVDNNLLLWNLSTTSTPVHTFVGHSDKILEFQWLKNNEDKSSEHELITLSKDQTMRQWHIVPYLHDMPVEFVVKSCPSDNLDAYYNTQLSDTSNASNDVLDDIDLLNFDSEIQDLNFSKSSCDDSYHSEEVEQTPSNLYQEFLSLNVGSEVFIEQKDPDRRVLIALVKINNNSITIHMTFPMSYPINVEPRFQITKSTYDASMKNKIHKVLYDAAIKQVSKNLTCVQFCLRELVVSLKKTRISFSESQFPDDDKRTHSIYSQSPSHYERTSNYISPQESYNMIQHQIMGLKFCNNGALLWFNSPPRRKKDFFPSISALKINNPNNPSLQKLQSHLFSSRDSPTDGRSSKSNKKDQNIEAPIISLYEVSCLFPINKDLASKYDLDTTDVFGTCMKNARIASTYKRRDLVQAWTLAAYACNINCNVRQRGLCAIDQINSWKSHPFTTELMDSLILHYAAKSDFQTAALLSCVYNPNPTLKNNEQDKTLKSNPTCSNNLSEESAECFEACDQRLLLDDSNNTKELMYDEYKKTYMNILNNMGLLDQEASVRKFLKHHTQKSSAFVFKFIIQCTQCKSPINGGYCHECKLFTLKCSLCGSSVKGASHVCLKCGHGGHASHLIDWFSKETTCAANCGCSCLFETMSLLHVKRPESEIPEEE